MGKLASQLALGRGGIWDQVARGQEPQRTAISRPVPSVAGVVTGDVLAATKAAENRQKEAVAAWLIGLGLATGHGDTLADLLAEAGPQIEAWRQAAAVSTASLTVSTAGINTPPTVSTAPRSVSTRATVSTAAAKAEAVKRWRLDHPEEYAAQKARSAAKRKAKPVG